MMTSLRNFFITLVLSLIVFGVASHFLVGFIEEGVGGIFNPDSGGTSAEQLTDSNGEVIEPTSSDDEIVTGDFYEFTALIAGVDDGGSQADGSVETDTLLLIKVNARTKTFMLSSLPPDMKVNVNNYTLRLGMVYSATDAKTLAETVYAWTGLTVDFYALFDYKALEAALKILGPVEFTVPMPMQYSPKLYDREATTAPGETTTWEIDIKEGKQMLSAKDALNMLRYRNYSNGAAGRSKTQFEFFKEILKQKLTTQNLSLAGQLFTALQESVADTNMTETDFANYAEAIFNFSRYTLEEITYPTLNSSRSENGVLFFIPDLEKAISAYLPFRKKLTTDEYIPVTTVPPLGTRDRVTSNATTTPTSAPTTVPPVPIV
ncbi:hypothetical protein FACS1894219_05530 [Clostridia bacterium]|nr:hypothetical protein FACS1894219_05530 [Clostridia bacterium]